MPIGSPYNLNNKSEDLANAIFIDNNTVSHVTSDKCLGVLLYEKLTFEAHMSIYVKSRALV